MASTPEYLEYVLDLLADVPDVSARKMMLVDVEDRGAVAALVVDMPSELPDTRRSRN